MEGIDAAKINNRKECIFCHYQYFSYEFKSQNSVCNGIAFITVKSLDYPCIVNDIRKPDAIHLLENSVFDDCRYKVNNHYFESLIKAKKKKKMKVFYLMRTTIMIL